MKKLCSIGLLALSIPAMANWQLDNNSSVVSFTTFKKTHVAENHRFHDVSASVADNGQVELTINLASVDTKIEIRDQRLKEHLFNVERFPSAKFKTKLDAKWLASIPVDSSQPYALTGTIDLHGQTQSISTNVLVTKVSKSRLTVTSTEPLLVSAEAFSLVEGINKLAKIAELPSITYTVPVNFVLNFNK